MTAAAPLPSAPTGAKIPYVYLLAASHSGSTLLAMLLNAHPDLATVGEIVSGSQRALEGYRCSCRRLIVECPFWAAVTERMKARHPGVNLADFGIRLQVDKPWWVARALRAEHRGPALEGIRDAVLSASPAFGHHLQALEGRFADFARTVLELHGARVLVDSSKLAHRLKFVLRMPSFDVKVLHLVRDGRAVALTYMDEQSFADAADPALRRRGTVAAGSGRTMPMERAAAEWRRAVTSASHLLSRLDRSRWMRITYEELCTEPDITLDKIFRFIGVEPSAARRDFRSVEHHVVGNGMRLDSTSAVRLDDRWRGELTAAEIAAFHRTAGDQNERFGYR